MRLPYGTLGVLACLGVTAWLGGQRHDDLELRLAQAEAEAASQQELERVFAALVQLRDAGNEARQERQCEQALLEQRLMVLEGSLKWTDKELSTQEQRLASWASVWEGSDPKSIEMRIEQVQQSVEQRKRDLEQLTRDAARLASEERSRLEAIDRRIDPLLNARDPKRLWDACVGPVVQLAGDATVGSGVLLESRRKGESEEYETYLLTAWHVVRDIYGSLDRIDTPVFARIYREDGSTEVEPARMVVYDAPLDIAVLRMESTRLFPNGARLASRERLREAKIFDSIYAVGCPLGNDPIPTAGEIAATNHKVDGCSYWMISAPTYIGNSGGGIFDARSHELMGIFSKIYTHGASRSTIVPHMGLATPMEMVYEWLAEVGQEQVALQAPAPERGNVPTHASAHLSHE